MLHALMQHAAGGIGAAGGLVAILAASGHGEIIYFVYLLAEI